MNHLLPRWSSLVLATPLLGACVAQAEVAPPPVTAQVNVNAAPPPPPPDPNVAVVPDAPVVGAGAPADDYQDTDPSALTDFHQALDAHGTWVDDPTYGTVWVPAQGEVGVAYAPYQTAGHWAYDDSGEYVWVSDYDWGWAPYHYGRWVDVDGRGWAWIPGRTYRGAWVNWGADDSYGYVGWYPAPPEYVWRGGVAVSYTFNGPARWSYVAHGDVFATNLGARVVRGAAAVSIAGRVHATATGGRGPSSGPPPEKLGFSSSQVPHITGAAAAGIAKAKQFGAPSGAVQLGGRPPSRAPAAATSVAAQGHTTITGTSATPTTTGTRPGTAANGATGDLHPTLPTERTTNLQQPVQGQPTATAPKKKKPTTEQTPAPKPGGGANKSGGGRPSGGRGTARPQ